MAVGDSFGPAIAGAASMADATRRGADPLDTGGDAEIAIPVMPADHVTLAPPSPAAPPRRATFLPFSRPSISEAEIAAVVDALRSDWLTTGPRVADFERGFAAFVGAPAAVALSSCTAGLHTALLAAGIGPGDEVVTSTMTFCATANVIEHVGARPVLVDVEPDTLNIDPAALAAVVGPRTRAVIPVHFAGHPAEMDAILDVAAAHRLLVLEDAAHALPARYRGRMIGAADHPVAFSFYATKNLTTAEGGMLTGPAPLVERARMLGLHGLSRDAHARYRQGGGWFYEVLAPGFKYNMTELQGALGRVQLGRLTEFQRRRREIVATYQAAFAGEEALELPVERPDVESAWHLYVLRLRLDRLRVDRARFVAELGERNIGASVHFIPVHLHPFYRERYGYRADDFPVAHANYLRSLSLPLHPCLSDADVGDVVAGVHDIIRRYRR